MNQSAIFNSKHVIKLDIMDNNKKKHNLVVRRVGFMIEKDSGNEITYNYDVSARASPVSKSFVFKIFSVPVADPREGPGEPPPSFLVPPLRPH